MKKFCLVLFSVVALFSFCGANAFAKGTVTVKTGLGFYGFSSDPKCGGSAENIELKGESGGISYILGSEYMYPLFKMVQVGAGVQYMFANNIKLHSRKTEEDFMINLKTLPVYASLQVSPFQDKKGGQLFIKTNLGYGIYYEENCVALEGFALLGTEILEKQSGGLYYAFGLGYDFAGGFTSELSYECFSNSSKYRNFVTHTSSDFDLDYSCVILKIGYKFFI